MKSAHVLAAFVVFLLVVDQIAIRRLTRVVEPRPRIRVYILIIAGHWLMTVWAAAVMGSKALWSVSLSSNAAKWLPQSAIIAAMVLVSLCAMALPAVLAWIPTKALAVEKALGKLSYVLPQNQRERLWWVMLSLTAGICEECVFRSFLFWYLQSPPWRLGFATAIGVARAAFAVSHLHQGPLPALGTGALALLFFVFFFATGNLLLPIAMHALGDLRVLFLIPRSARTELPRQ